MPGQLKMLRCFFFFFFLMAASSSANDVAVAAQRRRQEQHQTVDDFKRQRDKSADSKAKEMDQQQQHQLRHWRSAVDVDAGRQNKRQLAWEQRQLATTTTTTATIDRHRHAPEEEAEEVDADVAAHIEKRNHNNKNYNTLPLRIESLDADVDNDSDAGFSLAQWQRIEAAHRINKKKHQREILQALRQRNKARIWNNNNDNGDDDDVDSDGDVDKADAAPISTNYDVSAAKSLKSEDNRHDNEAENIYSRNYIPGKLTRHKVEQLGTPEAVVKSRRQHARDHALAKAHLNHIMSQAKCHVPQQRCERIQRDPSKVYTPHCTVLHRCSEDSGCCQSRTQVCAPKRTNNVELHFFVKSNNQPRPVTEKLIFVNHTECHCIERAKYEANGGAQTTVVQRATILSCTCPKLFEKILQEDGYCRCDCSSGNYGCDWLKRGSEHFSMNDRKCIQQGRCKPPTCEWGPYLDKHGRCPRQHEQPPQPPTFNAMS